MRKAVSLVLVIILAALLCLTACAKSPVETYADDALHVSETSAGPGNVEVPAGNNSDAAPDSDVFSAGNEPGTGAVKETNDPSSASADFGTCASESRDAENNLDLLESGNDAVGMDDILETGGPAMPVVAEPVASGEILYGNDLVTIDASNTEDGYIMIRYTEETGSRIKALITFPDGTTYQYNLTPGTEYDAFPLSGGSGEYQIGIYKNVEGTKYLTVYSVTIAAVITDAFAPFLQPNQYVNYTSTSEAVLLAAELTSGISDELEIVGKIYDYVITNISYDYDKASSVASGYLPDIDAVLESGKGICFDYAALMTAMLRSRGIPTKLVVGYTGEIYHAWISVYTEESGWVDGVIFFDGTAWKLMDPTFASSGHASEEIMEYIENTDHYTAKYLY